MSSAPVQRLLQGCALLLMVALHGHVGAQWLSPGALSAAHADLDGDRHCASCHASGSRVTEAGCLHCHADIERQRVSGSGLHGTSFKSEDCVKCHVEHLGQKTPLIRWPGPDASRFDHGRTPWPLREAHAELACARCHDRKNERGHPSYLGLDARCGSCHEDPHGGRFGSGCPQCHGERKFDRLDLTRFDHGLARFALEGQHAQVTCAKCHGEPARYRELEFSDCSSCHEDPHAGRLRGACKSCHEPRSWTSIVMPRGAHPGLSLGGGHQRVACERCHDAGRQNAPSAGARCVDCHAVVHEAAFGERCAECHAEIRWLGLSPSLGRQAHALTEFPLRGSHLRAPCAGCHQPELPPERRFRQLDHARCSACHVDAHGGSLRVRGDCATCHDEVHFAPSRVSAEIHAGFGFALQGAHAATPCSECHQQRYRPRARWNLDRKTCESCHANPHGSQFAADVAAHGCAGCHGTQDWGVLNFDHGFWPLTGAHASTRCAGCHAQVAGAPTAQLTAAPRECEGCHEDVHAGQFRLTGSPRSCDGCHTTAGFEIARFDHAERAGYPLTGKHAQAACASCHALVELRNGEQARRYRLGYRACADCHADPHDAPGAAK